MKKILFLLLFILLMCFTFGCKNKNIVEGDRLFNDGVMIQTVYKNQESKPYYVYLNKRGKRIINEVFTSASDFYKGYAIVTDEASNVYLINKKNEHIFGNGYNLSRYLNNLNYISYRDYSNNVFGLYGVLSYDGKVIIEPIYDSISYEESIDAFMVKDSSGKYGVIDNKGNIQIPIEYDKLRVANEYVVCTKEGQTKYVSLYNYNLKFVKTFEFDGYVYFKFDIINKNTFGLSNVITNEESNNGYDDNCDGFMFDLNEKRIDTPKDLYYVGIASYFCNLELISLYNKNNNTVSFYDLEYNLIFESGSVYDNYNDEYIIIIKDDKEYLNNSKGELLLEQGFDSIKIWRANNYMEMYDRSDNVIYYYSLDNLKLIYSYKLSNNNYYYMYYDKVTGKYYMAYYDDNKDCHFGKIENTKFKELDDIGPTYIYNNYRIVYDSKENITYVTKVGSSKRIIELDYKYRISYFIDGYFVATPNSCPTDADSKTYVYDSNFKLLFKSDNVI